MHDKRKVFWQADERFSEFWIDITRNRIKILCLVTKFILSYNSVKLNKSVCYFDALYNVNIILRFIVNLF